MPPLVQLKVFEVPVVVEGSALSTGAGRGEEGVQVAKTPLDSSEPAIETCLKI
jgi:hypothetical protein